MAKKTSKKNKKRERSSLKKNLLMTITLVPVVLGLLLILAWALELEILGNQLEVQVGIFFLLLGFTLSNALQRKFSLAAGWGSLAIADLIVLAWWNVWAQALASLAGLAGLIFLGIEFFKRYRQERAEENK
jgi:membrane-bound ClpP family serine protease